MDKSCRVSRLPPLPLPAQRVERVIRSLNVGLDHVLDACALKAQSYILDLSQLVTSLHARNDHFVPINPG